MMLGDGARAVSITGGFRHAGCSPKSLFPGRCCARFACRARAGAHRRTAMHCFDEEGGGAGVAL